MSTNAVAGWQGYLCADPRGLHPYVHDERPAHADADHVLSLWRAWTLQVRVLSLEDETVLALQQCVVQRRELFVCAWRKRTQDAVDAPMHSHREERRIARVLRMPRIRPHFQVLSARERRSTLVRHSASSAQNFLVLELQYHAGRCSCWRRQGHLEDIHTTRRYVCLAPRR